MASLSCTFSPLLDNTTACGLCSDYLSHLDDFSLKDCTREVSRHPQLYGLSADSCC